MSDTEPRADGSWFPELQPGGPQEDGAVAALEEQLLFTQELLDALPLPVFCRDGEGRYIAWNKAFLEFTGLPAETLASRIEEAILEEISSCQESGDSGPARPGEAVVQEARLRRAGSRVCDTLVYKAALRRTDGSPGGLVGAILDVSDRKKAEGELKRSELIFRSVFQESPFGMVLLSLDGSIVNVNGAFRTLLGAADDSLLGRNIGDLSQRPGPPPEAGKTFPGTALEIAPGERRLVSPSGGEKWVRSVRSLVHGSADEPLLVLEMLEDVTERRKWEGRLRIFEAEFQTLFGRAKDSVLFYDLTGRLLEANVAAHQRLEHSKDDFLRMSRRDLEPPEQTAEFEARLERLRAEGQITFETVHVTRAGARIPTEVSARLATFDGQPGVLEVARDLSDQSKAEDRNVYLATHDDLTGLPNRSLFQDRLAHAISAASRRGEKLAVLFFDLDDFKAVNDRLGHAVGDGLLKQVAVRLTATVRDGDTVARIGGDEFTVLVEEAGGDELVRLTQRILENQGVPFEVDGHELSVSASIGIAVFPDDGRDIPTLLRCADTAMYRAKEDGKGTHHFYSTSMNARAVQRIALETGLRHALERGEMSLSYQPQVSLATGQLTGAEAFLRWQHTVMGPIPPARFIPVADDTGLIAPLTAWVFENVCIQTIALAASVKGFPGISVNVSASHFKRSDVRTLVTRTLERTGANPRHLTLEIAESALLDDLERTAMALQAIREIGVRISINDLRIGRTSLALLRRLPIDELKIDQGLTLDMTRSSEARAIVEAFLSLARTLGMNTVAEGIETEEQRTLLSSLGCRSAQGFLFGPSAPAGALLGRDWGRGTRP